MASVEIGEMPYLESLLGLRQEQPGWLVQLQLQQDLPFEHPQLWVGCPIQPLASISIYLQNLRDTMTLRCFVPSVRPTGYMATGMSPACLQPLLV